MRPKAGGQRGVRPRPGEGARARCGPVAWHPTQARCSCPAPARRLPLSPLPASFGFTRPQKRMCCKGSGKLAREPPPGEEFTRPGQRHLCGKSVSTPRPCRPLPRPVASCTPLNGMSSSSEGMRPQRGDAAAIKPSRETQWGPVSEGAVTLRAYAASRALGGMMPSSLQVN